MSYEVKLEIFEGPLDLLLTLITREKLDITEISLAKVATQYWEYLALMQELNLEIESSYIITMAQLLEIKSRHLLPGEPKPEPEPLSPEEMESDLVERLKEYRKFKEASLGLGRMEQQTIVCLPRPQQDAPGERLIFMELSPLALLDAMQEIMRRAEICRDRPITMEKVLLSVPDKMSEIMRLLRPGQSCDLLRLVEKDLSRHHIITTFLALLELVRQKRIYIDQDCVFGTITVTRGRRGNIAHAVTSEPTHLQ
jgi:segregation and condensation protein A